MPNRVCVGEVAYDASGGVDSGWNCPRVGTTTTARHVKGRKRAVAVSHKAVSKLIRIKELTSHVSTVINPQRQRSVSVWHVEGGKDTTAGADVSV